MVFSKPSSTKFNFSNSVPEKAQHKFIMALALLAVPNYKGTMTPREKFLAEVETFLKRSGMKQTHFGFEAVGDGAFVTRLKAGAGVHLDTAEKVRSFMKDWRPERPSKRAHIQPAA